MVDFLKIFVSSSHTKYSLNLTFGCECNDALSLNTATRKKFIHEELPNNSETEDMRKIQ